MSYYMKQNCLKQPRNKSRNSVYVPNLEVNDKVNKINK